VAGGVLVKSDRKTWARTVIAVWNPKTGALKAVGRGYQVITAYTPPGGHYSLLAWLPAACSEGHDCPLEITNTATLSTTTVRSPLRHGFAFGGAFSPDGTRLAVFADTNPDATGAVRLAMVSTGTGALHLADSVRLEVGAPVAWALWLPDGRHFLTGGLKASYVVNQAGLSARPLFFIRGSDHSIEDSQDLNYSAVVVPLRR
jgi:WD40 repeat protein